VSTIVERIEYGKTVEGFPPSLAALGLDAGMSVEETKSAAESCKPSLPSNLTKALASLRMESHVSKCGPGMTFQEILDSHLAEEEQLRNK
jgi:hypothetical protein